MVILAAITHVATETEPRRLLHGKQDRPSLVGHNLQLMWRTALPHVDRGSQSSEPLLAGHKAQLKGRITRTCKPIQTTLLISNNNNNSCILHKPHSPGPADLTPIQAHERALELDPGSVHAMAQSASAMLDLGQPQQAVQRYRQALGRRPAWAPALLAVLRRCCSAPARDLAEGCPGAALQGICSRRLVGCAVPGAGGLGCEAGGCCCAECVWGCWGWRCGSGSPARLQAGWARGVQQGCWVTQAPCACCSGWTSHA